MRRTASVTGPVLAALIVMLGGAAPAGAHAVLVDTAPADGDTVEGGPDEVVLTFDEAMQPPATISVTDPDGDEVVDGDAEVDGQQVRASLDDLGVEGDYTVEWRAVSADDHLIDGTFAFAVTDPDGDEPEPADDPEPVEEPEPAQSEHEDGLSVAAIVVILALCALVGGGASWLATRRQRQAAAAQQAGPDAR